MKRQTLMSHNKELWSKIKPELNSNKRLLVLAATGTGKSFIGSEFIHYLRTDKKVIGNVIIVVKSISNIDQWKNILGIEKEDFGIEFITYNKLSRTNMNFRCIEMASIIILDEAHHVGANSTKRIFSHISEETYVLGLTADSKRYFDFEIGDVSVFFDSIINGLTVDEAIESGILNNVEYHVGLFALNKAELDNIRIKISRYALESQRDILLKDLDIFSSAEYMKITLDKYLPEKVKGIIFVNSYDDIVETEKLFKDMYPEASIYTISSRYDRKTYDNNLNDFKSDTNDMSFIISIDVMNEGHHIAGTNVCIFLRKTRSMQIYNQQFGRILSSYNSHIGYCFDFVNNINTLQDFMGKINESRDDKDNLINNNTNRVYEPRKSYKIQYIVDSELIDFVNKIRSLGYTYWESWEDDIIRSRYPSEGTKIIKDLPGRTKYGVKMRANTLGIKTIQRWESWEDDIIRSRYPSEGSKIIKDLPGRTKTAIKSRARLLGINSRSCLRWEEWEDDIIRNRYPSEGLNIMKDLPGRTKESIKVRASSFGIRTMQVSEWEEWEDDIIRNKYPSEGTNIIKYLPGRTKNAIGMRARLLGINNRMIYSRWEEWEDDIVRNKYPSEGTNIIKYLPGRTKTAIKSRARLLGINSRSCLRWEEWEDDIIRNRYPSEGIKIAKDLPGRSKDAIRGRVQLLGIKYKGV